MEENGIEIRETIDGLDAAKVAPRRPAKKTSVAKTEVKRSKADPYIWGIYITFIIISVVELFSASSTEVSNNNVYGPLIRHGIFLAMGFAIVLWLQNTHYIMFKRLAWLFAIVSLLLLLASSVIGVDINNAQRAIMIAGMTIQPAEIVKLAVVLLLATVLSKNQAPGGVTNRGVVTSAVIVVIFAGLLWKNGLTNTLLIMVVSVCMFLIGGIEWKKFLVVMGIYGVCAGALVAAKYTSSSRTVSEFEAVQQTEMAAGAAAESHGGGRAETHKGRLSRHLKGVKPTDPIDDMNRQVILSKFAQANGGLMGQGPGNSRESARLPLAFSDYIYSIIVEDTGFIGGAFLLLLYLLLLARAGRIAYKCSRAFPAFLIMGCAVMIVFQALVHMAIVTGLFPVSGQPLPFISKGGTSILVMSAAIGMMLSVSRYAVTSGNKQDIKAEGKELPDDMQAANYSNYELSK